MPVEVNKQAIRENFMDDDELIFESIDLFLDSSSQMLQSLKQAVAARNADQIMA